MSGVTSVSINTALHTVDVDYDDSIVSIPQMKNALDSNSYYVAYINLSALQAYNLFQMSSSIVSVDVRERSEYCAGHIPGIILSPWNSMEFQSEYLSILPSQGDILLVCRSGNRSAHAGDFLYTNSFSRNNDVVIYNVLNGMDSWDYATDICVTESASHPGINFLLLNN